MSLDTNQYGYLIDPLVPITDDKGTTIKDGFLRVFIAGSSTPVITYRNYDGAVNEKTIELDNSGRCKYPVIVSKSFAYKVVVYDAQHSQETPIFTVDKMFAIGANITAGAGATVVTGLDGFRTKPDGFVDASVVGTDGYVALEHTLVTDDLNTDAKVTAVENDRYIPLLNDDVNDPDSKITLGRLWQWVLGKIKSLSTTITAFRTGDVIPVDGPSGTAKMTKDDLLKVTANNALAGAVNCLTMISDISTYNSFDALPVGSMVLVAATLQNAPASGSAGSCMTIGSKSSPSVKSQLFFGARNLTICCRRYHDGAWDSWQYIVSRAELNAAVADLTLDLDTLFEISKAAKSSFTWTDSTFVTGSGTISSNPTLQLSNEITLADGFSLSVKCKGAASAGAVSIIAEKDGANYIPLVKNIDDSLREYSYTNNSGASKTVVISCKVQDAQAFALLKNATIDDAVDFVNFFFSPTRTALLVGTDGSYVKGNGDLSTNPILNLSQSFTLHPSQTISVSVTSSSTGGAVSVIASYDGANYYSLVRNTDANLREYIYTNKSSEDLTVYVSFKDGSEGNVVTIYNDRQKAEDDEEDALVYTPSLSVYQSLAVIGDSYASGALWKNNISYGDHYPISWPQVIGRVCGIETTNYTRGGASTRSFIADTTERGYAQMMSDTAKDIYFIVLGLNDSSSLGLEYLGDVSDIGTEADTFYGNYSKIVDSIQAHAPDAKIVLFTTPFTGATYNRDAFNSAIDNLATYYSLPCIHLYEDGFFTTSPMFLDRPGNHPTIVGYAGMAEAIKRLVEARMLDDMIYFNAFNS